MTSQINRKVNLRFSADPDEVEVYSGELNTVTLEYIRVVLTSVLPNPTNFVDQIVTVEERSVGETVRSYESTVIDVETSEDDVELTSCVLILRRPAQFQERRFPRVDVNFPVTIRFGGVAYHFFFEDTLTRSFSIHTKATVETKTLNLSPAKESLDHEISLSLIHI